MLSHLFVMDHYVKQHQQMWPACSRDPYACRDISEKYSGFIAEKIIIIGRFAIFASLFHLHPDQVLLVQHLRY